MYAENGILLYSKGPDNWVKYHCQRCNHAPGNFFPFFLFSFFFSSDLLGPRQRQTAALATITGFPDNRSAGILMQVSVYGGTSSNWNSIGRSSFSALFQQCYESWSEDQMLSPNGSTFCPNGHSEKSKIMNATTTNSTRENPCESRQVSIWGCSLFATEPLNKKTICLQLASFPSSSTGMEYIVYTRPNGRMHIPDMHRYEGNMHARKKKPKEKTENERKSPRGFCSTLCTMCSLCWA